MLRRTFLATLPLAAAGSSSLLKNADALAAEAGQAAAAALPTDEQPKFQAAGRRASTGRMCMRATGQQVRALLRDRRRWAARARRGRRIRWRRRRRSRC